MDLFSGRIAPFAAALAAPIGPTWRFRTLRRLKAMPKTVRMGIGVLLIIGGVLGFLPVLGFWMIPLGIIVLAIDIIWLRRRSPAINGRRNAGRKSADASTKGGET